MNKKYEIKCAVACTDSSGVPAMFFVKMMASIKQVNNGDHYKAAKYFCEEQGYEAFLVYDQWDSQLLEYNFFKQIDWDNVPSTKIEELNTK